MIKNKNINMTLMVFRFYYQLPEGWQGSVFDLFWVTMVTDYIVRFAVIVTKAFVAVTPQLCLKQKRKVCFLLNLP